MGNFSFVPFNVQFIIFFPQSINIYNIYLWTRIKLRLDPAYGQKDGKELITKNPAAYINPYQPLMQIIKGIQICF